MVARAIGADRHATEALGRLIVRLNVRHKRAREAERKLALARLRLAEFADRIGVLMGTVEGVLE